MYFFAGDSEKESNVPPTGERYKTGDIYESEKAEGETSKHVTGNWIW